MTCTGNACAKKNLFAITSLGKNRWYWVVWLEANNIDAGQKLPHLDDGYETNKAEAVDRALEIAGIHGEWIAAKYAKQYHRQKKQKDSINAVPAMIEFLYRDIYNEAAKAWHSVAHRVVNKSKKYVYVEQKPYKPDYDSGHWLGRDRPTFRLERDLLEREGYAFTPIMDIDDPLFFTKPYQERMQHYITDAPACFRRLGLTFPTTEAEIKTAYRQLAKQVHPDQGGSHVEFLALQEAYEQALKLCRYS